MAHTNLISKKVTVNGETRVVSYTWYPVLGADGFVSEKSYMRKTPYGTFRQSEHVSRAFFEIDGVSYPVLTTFVNLAGGGYRRSFEVDGKTFPDSHKKVIEYLLSHRS